MFVHKSAYGQQHMQREHERGNSGAARRSSAAGLTRLKQVSYMVAFLHITTIHTFTSEHDLGVQAFGYIARHGKMRDNLRRPFYIYCF
jgi:hypothetical protein